MARLFKKPKETSKQNPVGESLKELKAEEELDEFKSRVTQEKEILIESFEREKAEREALIKVLDNTIELKRQKREEAEVPLLERVRLIDERERVLAEKETQVSQDRQRAFETQREAERKLEDVQELTDQVGETRVRQMVKEKTLIERENVLKGRENEYLIKIEKFSHEINESAARIQERENAVYLKELNLQSKEENLAKREKELLNGHILLNDQRGTLERAWNELKEKQHGSSSKRIPTGR